MKLTMKGKGEDRWLVTVKDDKKGDEVFELDTRGQVYAFIRAARMLKVPDDGLAIYRTLEAEYGFSGE